jgi:hypothetical protein
LDELPLSTRQRLVLDYVQLGLAWLGHVVALQMCGVTESCLV